MSKTAIVADSTCDLSQELIKRYNITIFPLHIHLGEDEFSDGLDITPEEIYKWSDKNGATPSTSAVSPGEARSLLKRTLENADEVVVFTISSKMSSNNNVLECMARDLNESFDKPRIFVIDSYNLSTGIGLQVIEAAIMADNGFSASEIYEKIMEIRPLVRASFVVDTLTYLHRGGRCSGLAAFAGSALRLHPRIQVEDGAMSPGRKFRGNIAQCVMSYVKEMESDLLSARPDRVFITHSGSDKAIVDDVRAYLESLNYFDEILETRAGCVVSSHCGPGTLGVLFIAK